MTASIVTISSQTGSGGAAIARTVAEKLRYRYYDWEIISQAAQAAGVSPEVLAATAERVPTFLERMLRRLADVTGESEDVPAMPQPARASMLTSDDYRQFIEQVVLELAKQGDAVIVGHAGQAILKNQAGVLKVLVRGSAEKRAQRLAAGQGIDATQARATVDQSDRQRTEFFKRAYHMDWLDASCYDLTINADQISPDLAADMTVAAAREVP